jgi:hypothetical protein
MRAGSADGKPAGSESWGFISLNGEADDDDDDGTR